MIPAPALSRTVRLIGRGRARAGTRELPEEAAIAITCNAETQAVMMATPADLEDFAVGFALSEGIATLDEIEEVEIAPQERGIEARLWLVPRAAARLGNRRRATAGPVGCGLCGIESLEAALRPLPVLPEGAPVADEAALGAALAALGTHQPLHDRTHAIHAAGLFRPGEGLIAAREDVGRHNALDKLIGAMARAGLSFGEGFCLITSRCSYEMVQKAVQMGMPMLAAISAPTTFAVNLAERHNLTLLALARQATFTVFCHGCRVADPVFMEASLRA